MDLLAQIKPKMATMVNPEAYKTWLEPVEFGGMKENACVLVVPNSFFRDWVRENFESLIVSLLQEVGGEDLRIEYQIKKEQQAEEKKNVVLRKGTSYNIFNPLYIFENFVVGSSNQFANAACLAVANNPGKTYNPLFIYGGVGLGKTHLLHAVGNFIYSHGKAGVERICYIPAEVFTNEMINSIRYDKMEDFRNRYRKMDVLLIDDIQFIAGKERTQEEFFHTFNALYDTMKQIVVTSDKLPREIENFEERLRTRFEWGLIADIQKLDLETKVAILNKKAELNGTALPLDVAFFIASNVDDNVRSLEGSLVRIAAFASLRNSSITIDLTKEVMGHLISEKKKEITIDSIIKEVASYFSVKTTDIKSEKRVKSIMQPRQVAMYLCRRLTDSSLAGIGEKFGGKDHATIIHSVKKIEEEIKQNRSLKEIVEKLEAKIKST